MFRRAILITALLLSPAYLAADDLPGGEAELTSGPTLVPSKMRPADKDTFMIVYDDGETDIGYGAGDEVGVFELAMQFDLPSVPLVVDEIELCLGRTAANDVLGFTIHFWAADGPGGLPGTEIATASASATDVPTGFGGFFTYDISSLGIELLSTPVYIGVQWFPFIYNDFFLCGDYDAPAVHPGFKRVNTLVWEDLTSSDASYTALMVRGTFTTIDEIRLSDIAGLIVPGFEVDTTDPEGPSTFFAIRNGTGGSADVEIAYHGEEVTDPPLRTDMFTLGAQQTLPQSVRTNLTGLNVSDGFATGLIIVTEAGGTTAPNLEGDYFRLDSGNDFAAGDRLVRPGDFCLQQEIRFVDFGSGSQLRVLANRPRGVALPSFSYTAYNEAGTMVDSGDYFTSDHLSVLDIADLVAAETFGTVKFDFTNSEGGWVSAKYSAFGRFSLELDAACLDE